MSVIETLINHIRSRGKILLMFDYDGTLTPIVDKPDMAVLDQETREKLLLLANNNLIKVALVSGRSISDLKKLTGITNSNIMMFGLHGGEVLENNEVKVNVSKKCKQAIQRLKSEISDLSDFEGIIIEDKGYSIAIHYRLANEKVAKIAVARFKQKVEELELTKLFRYQEGKMVVEILPASFNKASAVHILISKFCSYLPVYFGDDKTDICAFREVKKFKGYSVLVGNYVEYEADECLNILDIRHFLYQLINPA